MLPLASPDPLSIAAQTPATNLLYPGGSGEVDAIVSNPNPFPVRINSLVLGNGGIGVDSAHSGCDTSALHFTSQYNGGAGWDVPAKVGATDGSARPRARRRDRHGHVRRERVPGRDLHDLTGDGPVSALRLGRRTSLAALLVGLLALATGGAYAALSGSKRVRPGKAQDHGHAAEADQPGSCGLRLQQQDARRLPVLARHRRVHRVRQRDDRVDRPTPARSPTAPTPSRSRRSSERRSESRAEQTWTVDTQAPPPPVFTRRRPTPRADTKAGFRWSDAERKTKFQCELDGAAYAKCGHSKQYQR